ncbi:MAG: type II toxin-antitoxin system death-on-curing family toxin [Prevotella sp.]|nr:type II toxin-antitoxin system death-on-curing family toxin [Prevotella sp.]
MTEIKYITLEELIHVYEKTVDDSGGGFSGIRDKERLESILEFVQNDLYYPTFEDKLTFLVSRICTGHLFDDGNKRMSLTLGVYFLHKNGRFWAATTFMTHMASFIMHMAAGRIDEELLSRIIPFVINGKEFNEELQIDIAHAISVENGNN